MEAMHDQLCVAYIVCESVCCSFLCFVVCVLGCCQGVSHSTQPPLSVNEDHIVFTAYE